MSAYGLYVSYCDYKGYAPVTDISFSSTPSTTYTNSTVSPVPHGNSKESTKPQHGYEIYNVKTGDVVKTGISGQPLNQNGTSPRANVQVNSFNKLEGDNIYSARVVIYDIPNREAALAWERNNAQILWDVGNSLSKHIKPNPSGR